MNNRSKSFCVAVLCVLALPVYAAEEKKPDLTESVIRNAIGILPKDYQNKLASQAKDILASAKPKVNSGKAEELFYYVSSKQGTSVNAFTEEFRRARKLIAENSEMSAIASALGRLGFTVISLSQPYHSEESAYKSDQHPDFERQLDERVSDLRVTREGLIKVSDPSDFAVSIAKRALEQLSRLKAPDTPSNEVSTSVFSLAVNSLASTWWSLLSSAQSASTEGYIGNKRSLKFHLPNCKVLPAEKNRVHFETRDQAIKEGYVPCKVCNP